VRSRARFLAGLECLPEERVQRLPERARFLRLDVGVFDLAEDLGLADQHRIEAGRDPEQVVGRLRAEQRVHVRRHVLDVAVAEVAQERFELLDPRLVIFEFRVDFEPPAGREHRRFTDHLVITQRDQGLGHPRSRKRMALPHVDRRGVVGQAETD